MESRRASGSQRLQEALHLGVERHAVLLEKMVVVRVGRRC
jgi:hypothetical protein